ncbi:PD-(D/E)XK motif protein [Virgibacillus sp. L01]
MELAEQIRRKFANLSKGNASIVEGIGELYASWAIKFQDSYGVGIEVDSEIKINESFANVSYYTADFIIEGENKYLLLLSSQDESLRNEFAGICALFLEPGENGDKRGQLKANPINWWLNWKNLIGNRNVEKTIHGVLGELITLFYLKKYVMNDIKEENWSGPEGKSIDIVTKTNKYEIKTSLIKYNNIVTISGQYQLEPNSQMSLVLVKLEDPGTENKGGSFTSIDSMIEKLAELGMDWKKLSSKVNRLGFKENSLDRKRDFRLLQILEYPVNDDFPLLSTEALKDVKQKDRILQLTYKINLAGLECNELNIKIT